MNRRPTDPDTTDPSEAPRSPATWDLETFRKNLEEHIEMLREDEETTVPPERLMLQLEQDSEFLEVARNWERLEEARRIDAWKRAVAIADKHAREVVPACLRCGECCRQGSPTLHLEDLELLKAGKMPWDALVTLRRGEPVHSPFQEKLFFLLDERIKVREKPGSHTCRFLEDGGSDCTVYDDRPLQCRAQACWDPTQARELAEQAYLRRADLFADVELLSELIAEHDRRCAFDRLRDAFERLDQTKGESAGEVLELIAYEEHFRGFLQEKLNMPQETLPLVFGRSFAELTALFGFRVETLPDGTRVLVPESA